MKKRCQYRNAWEKFPIENGEIWSAGDNRFLCADIVEVDINKIEQLIQGKVDMVYVSPPWNQSNLMCLRSKAGLNTPQRFVDLISRLIFLEKKFCLGMVYMEAKGKNIELFESLILDNEGKIYNDLDVIYHGNKNPCNLISFTFHKDLPDYCFFFTGVDYKDIRLTTIRYEKPLTIADFYVGQGLTARSAYYANTKYFGVEINKIRLANVLKFYADNGFEVKKVDLKK